MTVEEYEEYQRQRIKCWAKLKIVAEEYAQKYLHPHMAIIIDQRGIEELEGVTIDKFELLD